jgi:hypothetical protein
MNKTIYLFCEGDNNSLDKKLFDKVKIHAKNSVSIQPFRGKFGHSRFLEGYQAGFDFLVGSLGTIENAFIGFRDRDFDFTVPESRALINVGQNVFAGYLTTVENYLISTSLLSRFLNQKHQITENEVKNHLNTAATKILPFQAARFALGELRFKLDQKTNYLTDSEKLPSDFSVDDCRAKSHDLINSFIESTSVYTTSKFDIHFDKYLKLYQTSNFMDDSQYLTYFHGKTLMKQFSKELPFNFSSKDFYKFSIEQFDIKFHPDLVELVEKIDAL